MPLFDFKCISCGREFETLVMGDEKPCCPVCGSRELEKLMSSYRCRAKTKKGSSAQCTGCTKDSCATCH